MLNNSGINKVFLVGHIGKEPRTHFIDGKEMLCFPLVTTEFIKKNGVNTEHVEWHQIKMPVHIAADLPEKLCKAKNIYIEGKVETKNFADSANIKRYKTEIIASRAEILTTPAQILPPTQG